MKSFNKVTKVLAFTIVACLILSLIVPFANAKENRTISISKIDNGNLLFHDCNEEIEQNYYTPEDYEKLDYPDLKIYVWTGYTIEELEARDNENVRAVLRNITCLIEGRYVQELRDTTLPLRGSSNQRIIMMEDYWREKQST